MSLLNARARIQITLFVALSLVAGMVVPQPGAAASTAPSAAFTAWIPERLSDWRDAGGPYPTCPGENSSCVYTVDGIIDEHAPDEPTIIARHRQDDCSWNGIAAGHCNFLLYLDASGSTGGDSSVVSYNWTIVAPPDDVRLMGFQGSHGSNWVHDGAGRLTRSTSFAGKVAIPRPMTGSWTVSLSVTTDDGDVSTISSREVRFRDYLIFSVGDSVGSGEGNPDVWGGGGVATWWQDERCHRSADAGSAQAPLAIENSSPLSAVTFVHLACSGGAIVKGLLAAYEGQEAADPPLAPQMDMVGALTALAGRPVDALLVSASANDLGFGTVVKSCLSPTWDCSGSDPDNLDETEDYVRRHLNLLRDSHLDQWLEGDPIKCPPGWETSGRDCRHLNLFTDLQQRIASLGIPAKQVLITEYFDPTKNANGDWGNCLQHIGLMWWEMRWAYHNVVRPLNDLVGAAAQQNGWNHIGGIADAFARKGYCAGSSSWVRSLEHSFLIQGNKDGAFHPNEHGHGEYRDRMVPVLRRMLLQNSIRHNLTAGAAYDDSVAPVVSTIEPGATVSLSLDGAPFVNGTVVTNRGSHVLDITVTGADGTVVTEHVPFSLYWRTSVVTPTNPTGQITDPLTLEANLTSVHGPLAGRTVKFAAPGVCTGSATTDAAGVARFTCGPITAGAGDYPLDVTFSASDYLRASSTSTTLRVTKEVTIISAADAGGEYSDGAVFQATLEDDDGTPVASHTVVFDGGGCSGSATTDAAGSATYVCPAVQVPAGDHTYSATFAETATHLGSSTTAALAVESEDGILTYGQNVEALQVAEPGGAAPAFTLRATLEEREPDLAGQAPDGSSLAAPGDLSREVVAATLTPIGPGPSTTVTCVNEAVSGTGYHASLPVRCEIPAGTPVNTYEVVLHATAGLYEASTSAVLTVFDPSLGFATGGGTFLWPGTSDPTSFGFTVKYNKKNQPHGSLLVIRHLPDGTEHRIKSHSLSASSVGSTATYGWMTLVARSTYEAPGWLEPVGNHEVRLYAQDAARSGNPDSFWLQLRDPAGVLVPAMSLPSPATANAVPIAGGDISVPH